MLPHQQRVIDERDQLNEKVGKLDQFIRENPLFEGLDRSERHRLVNQLAFMVCYLNILNERIANFTP